METRLYLRAETTSATLVPDGDVCAVVRGKPCGKDDLPQLKIVEPLLLVRGWNKSPMFRGWRFAPLWYELDGKYAGAPRLITPEEYLCIWRDWFFYPSGSTYHPDSLVKMPISRVSFTMKRVMGAYMALKEAQVLFPFEVENLWRAANQLPPLLPASRRKLTKSIKKRLILQENGNTQGAAGILLREFLQYDHRIKRLILVKPWRLIV